MMGRFHTINILSIASSNLTWTFMAAHLPSSNDGKKKKKKFLGKRNKHLLEKNRMKR